MEEDTLREVCIAWAALGRRLRDQGEEGLWCWLREPATKVFWRTGLESFLPRQGLLLTVFRKVAAHDVLDESRWASLDGVPFGKRLKGFISLGRRNHEKAFLREERL